MRIHTLAVIAVIIFFAFPVHAQGAGGGIGIDMSVNQTAYLTDQVVVLKYRVYNESGRIVEGGAGRWYLNTTSGNNIANGTVETSQGVVRIPLENYNITGAEGGTTYYLVLTYTYDNSTAKKLIRLYLVDPSYYRFSISAEPLSGGFYPGTYVKISLESPVPSLQLNLLRVMVGSAAVVDERSLRFDEFGNLEYLFHLPENSTVGDVINITAVARNHTEYYEVEVQENYGFQMRILTPFSDIVSGDLITIAVTSVESGEFYYHFYVKRSPHDDNPLYSYFTSQSYLEYRVPYNYSGSLYLECYIYDSTEQVGLVSSTVNVDCASLEISASDNSYVDDESIRILVDFRSNVMKDPVITYDVYGGSLYGDYYLEDSGEVSGRSFVFKVPENAPDFYLISVRAYGDGRVLSSTLVLYKRPNIHLYAEILTKSAYATGVYTPGERIELRYHLDGNFTPGILYYGLDDTFEYNPKYVEVEGRDGVLSVDLPEGIRDGYHVIHLKFVCSRGTVERDVIIHVDSNPPWSQYLVFTVPAGDFITFVLLAALVIAALLNLKYGNQPSERRETKEEKSEVKGEILEEELE